MKPKTRHYAKDLNENYHFCTYLIMTLIRVILINIIIVIYTRNKLNFYCGSLQVATLLQ